MGGWINDNLMLLWLLLGGIGGIAVLRVLASFREYQIDSHNVACEARRIRLEYKRRLEQDKSEAEAF